MDGESLEVVDEVKLLGMVITSDLKWSKNTESMCKAGYSRLWMLRRLKAQGADIANLKDAYEKQVRSVLEFGTPVFTAGLTGDDVNDIERVQRTAATIMLGDNYTNYSDALQTLCLQPLKDRRLDTCMNFAQKAMKTDKFSNWFKKSEVRNKEKDRNCKEIEIETFLKPVKSRTKRFRKSPIPFLTKLLNQC